MFIKSIVIDGFKSYAKRTEITGFDPAFNAITGLNGSGKSNILDAICFLLGITNLSQVRASNLQELVYKCGQAGINKATVCIIFDNSEKSSSPIGYEQFDEITITRQIVVGGKNKYLINGIMAPNNRVQDLFRSVQLNVNNPHFLIMQGRITKVLNMKPREILSLLEEAANTKHYESKRDDTLKTIEKKDSKLKEIDKILTEEIKPKLEKLKLERSSYLEYQKIVRDLEYLNKFLVAYEYTTTKAIVDNADGEYNRLKNQLNQEEETIKKNEQQKLNFENNIEKLCEERDKVHVEKLQNMKTEFAEMQKQEAVLKNAIKRAEDEVKEAKENVKKLQKQMKEDAESQKQTKLAIAKIQGQFDKLKEKLEKSKQNYQSADQRLLNVNSGFFQSKTSNATGSLAELLSEAVKVESDVNITLNTLNLRLVHTQSLLNQLASKLGQTNKSDNSGELEQKQKQLATEIEQLKANVNAINYSQPEWEQAQHDQLATGSDLRRILTDRQTFIRRNPRYELVYNRPRPDFDSRRIIGVVANLVSLPDPQFSLSLQVGGGGRLFNVIIDHDSVAAELFEKNCLPNRTTFLPLNKMSFKPIPDFVVRKAKEILGKENVWSALEVIQYDKRYESAINFVFGGFLIARTLDMAKTVAFDERIKCRCVTFDGEVFDPEGSLFGGEQELDHRIFERSRELLAMDNSIMSMQQRQKENADRFTQIEDNRKRHDEASAQLRAKSFELRQLERNMMDDQYLNIKAKYDETESELKEITEAIRENEKLYRKACEETKLAKENLANSASIKEKAQKEAESEYKKAQDQLKLDEEAFKDVEAQYEILNLECTDNEQEQQQLLANIEAAEKVVTNKIDSCRVSSEKIIGHKESMSAFKKELDNQNRVLQEIEKQISQCKDSVLECGKNIDQSALRVSDINHRISTHRKDSEDAERKIGKLLSTNRWIPDESKHFNQSGGIYDFTNKDWKEYKQKIEKLEDEKRKLSRKVDLRGMNVLGQTEERYSDLMTKYKKVLNDKQVLQNVIDELDKLKDEVIKKAHEQVDRDFDKIFSTLLPGSQARLTPPEGKSLSEGLEFKIAFGNVWKESLNELSGGQRSLVALSLILALLRFKPAPLYILDEVDAALDISHTQNIGTIIKEQFGNSQFIIVSLKDGMFNNANVLFKTKFVDGVSTVSRHVNTSRRPMVERNL